MESNTNSISLKTEVDETPKRVQWSSENTSKLIEIYQNECKVLWDTKNPMYKDRTVRQTKLEYLATVFSTNVEEINRKLHNLRSQFNHELRKIKRRAASGESSGSGCSSWEYFEALLFLLREPLVDATVGMDTVNLVLADFQAEEELDFEGPTPARHFIPARSLSPNLRKPTMRVAATAPNPLPLNATPMVSDEPCRPSKTLDECQIFGDFVASELRSLRSFESRRKLKKLIQKAILQISDEEDSVHIYGGSHNRFTSMSPDPLR